MISLYDVLKASKGLPANDPIAGIWGRKLAGGKIQEIEGTLPLTITANGENLINYRIYGASGGAGERTESGEPESYKLNAVVGDGVTTTEIPIYIGDPLDAIGDYADYADYATGKLNRAVGILDLKGAEAWSTYGTIPTNAVSLFTTIGISPGSNSLIRCNALEIVTGGWYQNTDSISWWTLNRYFVTLTNATLGLTGNESATEKIAAFKRYLREQYDNGTPIKIWYVRPMAVEVDPPVPLPALPTLDGTTVYDADLMIKPSKMYVKYEKH